MSRRQEQFNSALQRALGRLLTAGLNDPRIKGIVTVTRAEVTPDFHNATIGVSVMPAEHEQRTVQGLRHAARHIQSLLYEEIHSRTIPRLHFEVDRSLKKQAEVLEAIQRAVESDASASEAAESEQAEAPASDSSNPASEGPLS